MSARYCRTCPPGRPTILSRYNPDDECSVCVKSQPATSAPKTRPGSQRARMLEAMPGTASEISTKTGLGLAVVQAECRVLARDGRASYVQIPRSDGSGMRNVYSREVAA